MKTLFSLILLLLSLTIVKAQDISSKLIVLQPTGEMIDDLPVMTVLSDTSELFKKVDEIAKNSFVKETLSLYLLAANYLKNKYSKDIIEPAYLALTQQDGGFAKLGFHLKQENGTIEKANVPYIDIVEGRIDSRQDKLMSFTQLYPHEMGHLLYGMLNESKGDETSRSVDMHYFSLRTDYSTAFNEGFSEHMENIARLYEKNDSIRNGIFADLKIIKNKSEYSIRGFEKDLKNRLRIGYFKMSMPLWFQKFEDYKRHEHAVNGQVIYRNATMELPNIEDQLTYRNSGVRQNDGELRNYIQMLSTEGVISAFYTRLTQSDLSKKYQEASFYLPFLPDTSMAMHLPNEVFTPLQNQFLKYFYVFHNYMTDDSFSQSQLIDFMEGYISAFPFEEVAIKDLFKEVTHLDYTCKLPPDLWLLIKDHPHRLLALDPYDAITMPVYTFDINAAEVADLLTIKGIQKDDALKIINYRKTKGFFTSLDQIKEIGGLSTEAINLIIDSEFDAEYFEGLSVPDLTFSALLTTPLKSLLFRTFAYFILIFGMIFGFFLVKQKLSGKKVSLLMLRCLLQWILFVLAGLIFVVLSDQAWLFLLIMFAIVIGINLIIHRKKKAKMWRSLFASTLMALLILISII